MSAAGLTPQMAKCKAFIATYITEHRVSPSYGEICAEMGLTSKSHVHRLVTSLIERGHINRVPARARSITVVADICPCCGQARAA